MDDEQILTEEQTVAVKTYCDKIDEFLAKFKENRTLKAVKFSDGIKGIDMISKLDEGCVKSAVFKYFASCDEAFEIFALLWKGMQKRSISNFLNSKKSWDLAFSIANLTDGSDDVCSAFGEKGILRLIMVDLQKSRDKFFDRQISFALTIIYNCCWRVPENRIICREYIDTLQGLSESKDPEIQADAFLALSYIVDKSEAQKISLNEPCLKFLLLALKAAMHEPDRRSPVYGYSVHEVLQGLNQLLINDSNKLLLADLDGMDVLERVLMEKNSDDKEKLWAARGIWQMAFKEENKNKIHQNPLLLSALENIREATENEDVKDACSGALFVIDNVFDVCGEASATGQISPPKDRHPGGHRGHSTVQSSVEGQFSTGSGRDHIMISYQHASQQRVLRVKRYLEEYGYNVWMDVDQMSGDILNAMAQAVQEASVVLVCMTSKFKESQHCRTEATYAYTLNKDIIPLMLQDQFTPEDWLGALMGMKKYYPVFSDDLMNQSLPDLVKELGDRGKHGVAVPVKEEITGAISPVSHGQMHNHDNDDLDCSYGNGSGDMPETDHGNDKPCPEGTTNLCKWNVQEATGFLRSHGLDTDKEGFRNITGTRLKQIRDLFDLAPEFCLKNLKDELRLSFWEVLSFVEALKKL